MVGFKRRVNVVMTLLLSIVFLFMFAAGGVFVKAEEIDEITEEEKETMEEFIIEVQTALSEEGTTVEIVLYEYSEMLKNSQNTQVRNIGENAARMLQDYTEAMDIEIYSTNGWIWQRVQNAVCRAAVACAVAYFVVRGYSLSAELLIIARANDDPNYVYYPSATSSIVNNQLFWDIGAGHYADRGDAEFAYGRTKIEHDAYFSIKWFSYTVDRYGDDALIHIRDRYDFAVDTTLSFFVKLAVDVMITAQNIGVITPYDIEIDEWYYGEVNA